MVEISSDPDKFFRILEGTHEPAYDVETNGLDWKRGFVCGYSISDGEHAVYVPVRHGMGRNINNVEDFERLLSEKIRNHKGRIVGHNIKFDAHFSQNHGIILGNKVIDTMVMACLLNENRTWFNLESVAKEYNIIQKAGKELYVHIANMFGCKPTRDSMGHFWRLSADDKLAVEYAAYDTLVTKQLWECQKKQLYAEQLDLVRDLENELCYVLQKMERRGIGVDPQERETVCAEIEAKFIEAYCKIPTNEIDLSPLNIRSGKDLREYFEMCDITDWPMTAPSVRHPNGQPSFNKNWLATTQEGLDILNARKYAHLKSSFIDNLDTHIYNNKIHTTFNQARGETHGTRGGRLSSSNPNMQQVPKRDEELGRIYRRMFKARKGFVYIEFDYSQAEPRLYTHYSNEPTLVRGYTSTPIIDMHGVAAQYMHVERKVAKNLNLGIMYTMGPKKLAVQLGIPYSEALAIYKLWHATFPLVSDFTKRAQSVAEQRGYVRTILGRRRRFPDERFAYRAANSIVQGGSADIMKYKLVQLDRYLESNNLEDECQMLLTIHDSVVFEIVEERLEHYISLIEGILTDVQGSPFNLRIPFTVDYGYGFDWSIASYGEPEIKAVTARTEPAHKEELFEFII